MPVMHRRAECRCVMGKILVFCKLGRITGAAWKGNGGEFVW
jgi:hypothetical protein